MTLYAHSLQGRPESDWEPLDEHLRDVAKTAQEFTAKFGAREWGRAAGLLHDIGKAKPEFQDYIRKLRASEPHAAEGGRFAAEHYGPGYACPPLAGRQPKDGLGRLLAYVIAGHHAGLANGVVTGGGLTPLTERLKGAVDVRPLFTPTTPRIEKNPRPLQAAGNDPFGWAFFTRMVFSALVDADRLETECWEAGKLGIALDRGWAGQISTLKSALDGYLAEIALVAEASAINILRAEVLADARAAAVQHTPGLFSLTVPTGGGKTLSSLAFALDHAIKNELDRVIYVIPFTSIVEQTANEFRKALGNANEGAILEHHSGFDTEKLNDTKDEENSDGSERIRRDTQNWNRPIIVTTAVQFFESLFSNRTGQSRKLHNIARAVVVLDEAQTLPLHLLRPCLAAINELSRGYSTSVVLCTATQPALTKEAGLKAPEALDEKRVREIVAPGRDLFNRLKRVRTVQADTLSDAQLVEALSQTYQALVVVNNRRHARELFELLAKSGIEGARHLTTAMTAAHRQHVLADIRLDLDPRTPKPVRLISTSLIEAGVDISFKAVWRAWAGLDQMAQAAGRCNRNGELGPEGGVLTIFQPEEIDGRKAPPELRQNADAAASVLAQLAGRDPLSKEAVAAYFKELLWRKEIAQLDNVDVGERKLKGIMKATSETAYGLNFCFADIAQAFNFIKDTMVPVIIPATAHAVAGAPAEVINALKHADKKFAGGIAKSLQRHIVQIPRSARRNMIDKGAVVIREKDFGDQFVLLDNLHLYKDTFGLKWDDPTYRDIEGDIV
jgi:CRISPR-associated endonuclease/helicase Cas3